jgi:hypothetical protein
MLPVSPCTKMAAFKINGVAHFKMVDMEGDQVGLLRTDPPLHFEGDPVLSAKAFLSSLDLAHLLQAKKNAPSATVALLECDCYAEGASYAGGIRLNDDYSATPFGDYDDSFAAFADAVNEELQKRIVKFGLH